MGIARHTDFVPTNVKSNKIWLMTKGCWNLVNLFAKSALTQSSKLLVYLSLAVHPTLYKN
jgi:hypothetical protein